MQVDNIYEQKLEITLSDGTKLDAGTIIGVVGDKGNEGPQGEVGPKGDTAIPEISMTAQLTTSGNNTPAVLVTKTGTNDEPNFNFEFRDIIGSGSVVYTHNIKITDDTSEVYMQIVTGSKNKYTFSMLLSFLNNNKLYPASGTYGNSSVFEITSDASDLIVKTYHSNAYFNGTLDASTLVIEDEVTAI